MLMNASVVLIPVGATKFRYSPAMPLTPPSESTGRPWPSLSYLLVWMYYAGMSLHITGIVERFVTDPATIRLFSRVDSLVTKSSSVSEQFTAEPALFCFALDTSGMCL